jgi:hypothetical protein
MVYNPLALKVALVDGLRLGWPVLREILVIAEAVEMWESRRDLQGVWEEWEAGFMAFHAFHTPSFPWLAVRLRVSEQIERCRRRTKDKEIAEHSHVIDLQVVALLHDWPPKA